MKNAWKLFEALIRDKLLIESSLCFSVGYNEHGSFWHICSWIHQTCKMVRFSGDSSNSGSVDKFWKQQIPTSANKLKIKVNMGWRKYKSWGGAGCDEEMWAAWGWKKGIHSLSAHPSALYAPLTAVIDVIDKHTLLLCIMTEYIR